MKAYRYFPSPLRSRPPAGPPLVLVPLPSVATAMPLRARRPAPELGVEDAWRAPDPMARGR